MYTYRKIRNVTGFAGTFRDGTKRRKQVGKVEEIMHSLEKNELKLLEVSISSDPTLPPWWMLSPFHIPAFLSLLQCEERDLAADPNRNASIACSPLPQRVNAESRTQETVLTAGNSRVRHENYRSLATWLNVSHGLAMALPGTLRLRGELSGNSQQSRKLSFPWMTRWTVSDRTMDIWFSYGLVELWVLWVLWCHQVPRNLWRSLNHRRLWRCEATWIRLCLRDGEGKDASQDRNVGGVSV